MDFIDIDTAVRLTKTSDSTIRRWLRTLPTAERQKYVSSQGKKLVISKAFLQKSFQVEAVASGKPQEVAAPVQAFSILEIQKQQLAEKDKQISRLQDLNDRLLADLKVKDDDVKAAWSKVLSLQDENKLLAAGQQDRQQPGSIAVVLLVVCVIIAVAGVVLAFFVN